MNPPFATPVLFVISFFVIFLLIVGRYFLIAGIFYLYFHVWKRQDWSQRSLGANKGYDKNQFKREMRWSVITALIFSLTGAAMVVLWALGHTRVYVDDRYPVWWSVLCLPIFFFLHETYYYWIHRFMHRPFIFKLVHQVHHESHIPSPWTAFSFHPLEGVLQAVIIPLLIMVIPIHLYALIFMFTCMTLSSVINHLGIEIYPGWFQNYRLGRLLIGATHHALHHKQYKYNFGLYFTFWDQWGGTESPHYRPKFDELTQKKGQHHLDADP
jgi:sterol desaturase/sphingolipid hydroxylase (fatty acid hydroxylase superfamily)